MTPSVFCARLTPEKLRDRLSVTVTIDPRQLRPDRHGEVLVQASFEATAVLTWANSSHLR